MNWCLIMEGYEGEESQYDASRLDKLAALLDFLVRSLPAKP